MERMVGLTVSIRLIWYRSLCLCASLSFPSLSLSPLLPSALRLLACPSGRRSLCCLAGLLVLRRSLSTLFNPFSSFAAAIPPVRKVAPPLLLAAHHRHRSSSHHTHHCHRSSSPPLDHLPPRHGCSRLTLRPRRASEHSGFDSMPRRPSCVACGSSGGLRLVGSVRVRRKASRARWHRAERHRLGVIRLSHRSILRHCLTNKGRRRTSRDPRMYAPCGERWTPSLSRGAAAEATTVVPPHARSLQRLQRV